MPWSGGGTFTLVYNWPQDQANGISILPSRMQAQEDDIATGLDNCLTLDGQTIPTANINLGGFRFTNVDNGSAATDFVALGQLQTPGTLALFATGLTVSTSGVTVQAGGITVTGASTITGALTVTSITASSGVSVSAGGITVASGGVTVQAGGASITGNSAVVGTLTTTNGITAQAGDINVSSGNVTASGNGTFSGNATIGGALNVAGGVALNGGGVALQVPNGQSIFNILQTSGSSSSSNSGYSYTSSGVVGPTSGAVGFGIVASGSSMLAASFFAASDVRLKDDIQSVEATDALRWVNDARPVTYRKRPYWYSPESDGVFEGGFIAQDEVRRGFGRFASEAPHPGMPETEDGPADIMLTLPVGYQIANLTAALKNALDRIEQLEKSR